LSFNRSLNVSSKYMHPFIPYFVYTFDQMRSKQKLMHICVLALSRCSESSHKSQTVLFYIRKVKPLSSQAFSLSARATLSRNHDDLIRQQPLALDPQVLTLVLYSSNLSATDTYSEREQEPVGVRPAAIRSSRIVSFAQRFYM
jgi:hypothetical protein